MIPCSHSARWLSAAACASGALVVLFGIALLVGCGDDSAATCDDLVNCPAPDSGACTADEQCAGQVCDTAAGACVECTPARAEACMGTTPVCGDAGACTGCTTHAECPDSHVCLPDGACAAATEVAYVDPAGSDNSTCSEAMPCPTIAAALATSRPYVKLTGTLNEQVILDNRDVTFHAAPGAKLTDASNGILVRIDGSSQVAIYDLEISGGSGPGNPGISMQPGNTASLTLVRAKVTSNAGAGIAASGGTLTVSQSTIASNQGGGIAITGGTFAITNNLIFRNGNSTNATVGGASLAGVSSSVFAFNTVVDNQIQNSGALAGGVFCDTAGLSAPNNIIARNYVNNDATRTNANTSGLCTYPTSQVAMTVAGLAFRSPDDAPHDYRIQQGSVAIDQATTSSAVTVDIDGEVRPHGAAPDQGADEYVP